MTDAVTDDAAATSRRAATPTTDTSPAGTTRSGAGSFAPERNGYLLVALAALLWALLGVFSKRLLAAGVPPTEIAFWRAALGGAAFVLHASLRGRLRVRNGTDLAALAAFAAVGVTLFYAALNLAIDAGGVSLAFVLLYSAPAFVAVLAALLLGERLTLRKSVLVALSIAGVVLVARAGGGEARVGTAAIAWGLTAGLSYASYYLFGKWILARYAPVTIYAVVMPLGALGLAPLVRFEAVRLATPEMWLDLALMALLSTYLAYLVYYTGLRRTEASRAVLVATIEPVAAAVLAAALFGERLGPWGLVGGALVLTAAVLSSLPAARARRRRD